MIRMHSFVGGSCETADGVTTLEAPSGWIEVTEPSTEELDTLASALGLHPLAIEDALREGHPPKLEEFADHLFVIAHTPVEDENADTRKMSIFLSKAWVVSIVRTPLPSLEPVRQRVVRSPKRYLAVPAVVAHALLDFLTDGFEDRIEEMGDRAAELEDQALDRPDPEMMGTIASMRRDVARLLRVVRSQRDVSAQLAHSGHSAFPKKFQPFLRDVYDHLLRVHDVLETVREGVAAARDAYLTAVNNQLNEVMRVLTVIATIMMPLSLIAGIYGMNFTVMPGTEGPVGFWVTMAAMAIIGIGMLIWFRARRWL